MLLLCLRWSAIAEVLLTCDPESSSSQTTSRKAHPLTLVINVFPTPVVPVGTQLLHWRRVKAVWNSANFWIYLPCSPNPSMVDMLFHNQERFDYPSWRIAWLRNIQNFVGYLGKRYLAGLWLCRVSFWPYPFAETPSCLRTCMINTENIYYSLHDSHVMFQCYHYGSQW